jgi:hypothetical protein
MIRIKQKYIDVLIVTGLALIFFSFLTYFKYLAGADERAYYRIGEHFVRTLDYTSPKHHPLYAVLIGILANLGFSMLLAAKLMFILSGMILWVSISALLKLMASHVGDSQILQTVFVGTMPGASALILYSGTSLLYLALVALSITLILYGILSDSKILHLFAGIVFGLAYLTRADGIIQVVLIIFGLLILQRMPLYAVITMLGFALIITPWQLYLYEQRLYISSVVSGGWNSSVWNDGPMKHIILMGWGFLIYEDGLKVIVQSLAKNIQLYSQHIGSVRVFPFIYLPLVGIAFIGSNQGKKTFFIITPILVSFSYLWFYVEARYLASAACFLALFAAIGLNNLIRLMKLNSKVVYLTVICLNLTLVLTYLLFGHETYSRFR